MGLPSVRRTHATLYLAYLGSLLPKGTSSVRDTESEMEPVVKIPHIEIKC